ncbi:DUF222 domain-containing protein [Ornithinimicrobium ciconiae]|uniref:DUF222 domain-containing protein n=1 Tax=Ornithinimicrobium ciconiae TaxID=2594265 RepID=A0A516GCS2_9MICO|nr:HNH endonuclease signature motif containing protein [Ornithinimicrobium ciconiae]QDO89325.1 DUF222 domain-containing protein [Ornithinimicrobium ciconiae]
MKSSGVDTTAGQDLAGVDLPGVDLPGSDLPGSDLPGSDLPGAEGEVVAGFGAWEAAVRTDLGEAGDPESAQFWALVAQIDQAEAEADAGADGGLVGGGRWVDPAQELMVGLAGAGANLARASAVDAEDLVRVFEPGIVSALETVGRVRAQVEGLGFALAVEASTRGLPTQVGLTLGEWLRVRCPWISRQEGAQIADIVRAGKTPWGTQLGADVAAGITPVRRAWRVAKTMFRLAGCLQVDQQIDYAQIATSAAANPDITDPELELVCKKLLIDLLDKKPREDAKRFAHELRCVSRRPLATGLTRLTIDAPDADAALLEGVLNGPLAAPAPAQDGTADQRSWGQRAYDALIMVINRGMSNPGSPPSSGRASVMITIKADPTTGKPVGAGVTALGQILDPEQVGRFACTGDVTPIALGDYGEPLYLGRTVRLATPGQFKALLVRDGGCTFAGCTVPGTYCDAHHLAWWSREGGTDILNLVLLCPRHHTLVHDKDLTATIRGSNVTWHL